MKNKKNQKFAIKKSNTQQAKSKHPANLAVKTAKGYLKVHRDGYAFVLSSQLGVPDVFVPARRLIGAMDGDLVLASITQSRRDGRLEGSVIEILARGRIKLMGTLKVAGEKIQACVKAGQQEMLFGIVGEWKGQLLDGQDVGIEVIEFPKEDVAGTAKLTQVFADRGKEDTEIAVVILKHQLPTGFPEEVLKDADRVHQKASMTSSQDRRDLRDKSFVTIDGASAKDFDDAVYVQREKQGYRLWVSIADVSHYVEPGSLLDRDAYARGTSVYFPGQCIPMLPEVLSNDLCSLRPHQDRMTLTAELRFDLTGQIVSSDFYKSIIRSQARLTYDQVSLALIDHDEELRVGLTSLLPMLEGAMELSKKMRILRQKRGSIDFDLPEPEIISNLEDGNTEAIVKSERNGIHLLIEDFMIAANEAVATFIHKKKWPSLYRVHERPDPTKINNFHELLNNLNFTIVFPKDPPPGFFADILSRLKEHPEKKLIEHTLLRSMKQAIYHPENLGHFGLASKCYTHFTSPIRRYSDLVVHRELKSILSGQRLQATQKDSKASKMLEVAGHVSRRERVAMEAEWEAIDLKVALFMQQYVGQDFHGTVARVTRFGVFVELTKFFVTGLVTLIDLKDDYYVYDEKKMSYRGRKTHRILKLGTEMNVRVSKVDIEERKIYFVPI